MAKNSVNPVATAIAEISKRFQHGWTALCRACAGQRTAGNASVEQRDQAFSAWLRDRSDGLGEDRLLSRQQTRAVRSRLLHNFGLVAVALACTTTLVFGQSGDPCPPSGPDAGNVTENLIKGTMRYHEWAIEVLEEVTASVSGRLQSPDGADANSITVFMDVVAGGEIDELAVEQGSGDTAFDDEFVQAIQSLAPFSIDTDYMQECSLARLALSIKWLNGGSLTEIRSKN